MLSVTWEDWHAPISLLVKYKAKLVSETTNPVLSDMCYYGYDLLYSAWDHFALFFRTVDLHSSSGKSVYLLDRAVNTF